MDCPNIRYATVRGARDGEQVAAYMPGNYSVIHVTTDPGTDRPLVVIAGRDNAGWTLQDYVTPRLASGLLWATEIDLSHPVMLEIPA